MQQELNIKVYTNKEEKVRKKNGDDVLSNQLARHVMCSTGTLGWSGVISLGNSISVALMS